MPLGPTAPALLIALLALGEPAPEPAPEGPAPATAAATGETLRFNQDRRRLQLGGMLTLTTWAVANLSGGAVGFFTSEDERKFFHQMNALWNLVNLPLGIVGLVSAVREDPRERDAAAAREASRKQQRVYLINTALDLVYIMGGGLSWALGAQHEVPRAVGYGQSVVLQGGFLLLFDGVMTALHERRLKRFNRSQRVRLAPTLSVGPTGASLRVGGQF